MRSPHLLLIPLLLGAATAGAAAAGADRPDWFGRMQSLSETLTRVYVNALTDGPRTARDDQKLVADAKRLAALAQAVHELGPEGPMGRKGATGFEHNAAPDADPSLALIAKLFADETRRMAARVEGHPERAADLATGVAAFCMACHTRTDKLRELIPPPSPADLSRLNALDRATLLVATHRFDDARKELAQLLASDRFAQEDVIGWRRAVTSALVLEVRTSRDPDAALLVVERVLNGPVPGARTWDEALSWQKSLLAWRAEKVARPTRPDVALREARRLLDEAESTPREIGDRSADVLYLRATAELHDFLAAEPRGPAAARAFSMLAVSYRRLRELGVWSLARLYDEACIRTAPGTDLARECFARYEVDVRRLDEDERGRFPQQSADHLKVLEKIARGVKGP